MAKERKTVAWRQKFQELAALVLGGAAMTMSPDDVIAEVHQKAEVVEGLLDRIISKLGPEDDA